MKLLNYGVINNVQWMKGSDTTKNWANDKNAQFKLIQTFFKKHNKIK